VSRCIQCGETAVILLTRQRPLMRGASTYQVCTGCARDIKVEQASRVTISQSRTDRQSRDVLAGITQPVSPSRRLNASPASSRESTAEGDLFQGAGE
jgi:hypothetical protein